MGAKGSAEAAAKLNAENWGHLEVCMIDTYNKWIMMWKLVISDSAYNCGNTTQKLIQLKVMF